MSEPKIETSWKEVLGDEFQKPTMQALRAFLKQQLAAGKTIFPSPDRWFNALNHTPFDQVKLVILGQDPYHGPGQAHGLSFSVLPGVAPPPSLLNIYKELESDVGVKRPDHGFLGPWADQGVLLLNAVLTVEQSKPASHQGKGWELFTDRVIQELNQRRENLVFVLWGAYAIKKGSHIDRGKHFVIQGPHPSPLSASRGFFGSKPFSKANTYLKKNGKTPISWQLPTLKQLRENSRWKDEFPELRPSIPA